MIKKHLLWSISSLLLLLFVSCSEDIDLSPDGKETAVVYALLDQADSIHYVRINRAFYGGSNALKTAQIPDSSYFKQVDAYIYEVANGDTLRSWKLRDTLVTNKDTNGIFYAPQQKLYYFKTENTSKLVAKQGYEYKLNISVDNKRFVVTGNTELIRYAKLGFPASLGNSFNFATNNIAQNGYKGTSVNFSPGNAAAINVYLDILINEIQGNQTTLKTINWNLGDMIPENGIDNSMSAEGEKFYQKIASQLEVNNNVKRQLKAIDIVVHFVSSDFYQYQTSLIPSSSIAQSKREFTNLSVTNGMRVRGLFSARSRLSARKNAYDQYSQSYYYRAIDQASMKELCQGQYTGTLNFCSDVPSDSKESFYCN